MAVVVVVVIGGGAGGKVQLEYVVNTSWRSYPPEKLFALVLK